MSVFVNSLSGAATALNLGINFTQYIAIPRKLRTPLAVFGAGAFLIALAFLGSGMIPLPENINLKNVKEDLFNLHFFLLRVRFYFRKFLAYRMEIGLGLPEDDDVITNLE